MIEIENMTVREVRKLAADLAAFLPGNAPTAKEADPYPRAPVLIRTVTHYLTGRVVDVTSQEIVLDDAAWVANTGRFELALRTGELSEVEPIPGGRHIVGRGAVVDCSPWDHPLPRDVK